MHPRPPERIYLDGVVLRRYQATDAPALVAACAASRAELGPWMAWATDEGVTEGALATFIAETTARAAAGHEVVYGLFDPTDGSCLGGCGLHHRAGGPGCIEVGYWLRTDATGRGLMTRTVAALTDLALGLDGVTRVEVHCDATNTRSAAIPARLGFTLTGLIPREPAAPADTDQEMVWTRTAPIGPGPTGAPPTLRPGGTGQQGRSPNPGSEGW